MKENRIFDTRVQYLKYRTIKEVIRAYDNGTMNKIYIDIPKKIIAGPKATMRCCIYKERAIVQERIRMACGGDKSNANTIEVIDVACDNCPAAGIHVTSACRGCLLHACAGECPKDAISFDSNQRAVIDHDKCIECGKCTKACPYGAIITLYRPCIKSCKVGAISVRDEDRKAVIDESKCIECGACVYACPFGAMADKSEILDVVELIKKSENNTNYNVYAIIAPAIVSQFKYAKIEQVVMGLKKLGFHQVVEAALGADITLHREAHEWAEKGIMTTSCCPSFVMYIEKHFPELVQYISSSPSPMVETAMLIKRNDKNAKCVFIGPCSSKKKEHQLEKTEGAIDNVLSFEELQSFLDARYIDVSKLDEVPLDNASFYGRLFAKAGGIKEGLLDVAKDMGVEGLNPINMNGIDECKIALLKLKLKKAGENFFEGMACDGGCINGALCLTHGKKNALDVDKYGKMAKEKTIDSSVKLYKLSKGLDKE